MSAHKFKGSLLNFGADHAARLAGQLETMGGKSEALDGARGTFDKLEQAYEKTCEELSANRAGA